MLIFLALLSLVWVLLIYSMFLGGSKFVTEEEDLAEREEQSAYLKDNEKVTF